MSKSLLSLCLLPALLTASQAYAAKALSIDFTISGTNGFNGVDTSSLVLKNGKLSGTVSVISPGPATYTCVVNSGSTDIRNKLHLTCTIGPDEMVTLVGTLKPRAGSGRGTFSETFFKEQGTYKAMSGNLKASKKAVLY